jgi:hypothetical protein
MRSDQEGNGIVAWGDPWLIQRLKKPRQYPEGHFMKGKDNPFAFGGGLRNGGLSKEAMDVLRNIFTFDYMGSAEFEFGALPKALASMAISRNELVATSFSIDMGDVHFDPTWDGQNLLPPKSGTKKDVYLIAAGSHAQPAEKFIRSLVGKRASRLKEASFFREALLDLKNPERDSWLHDVKGWLDIENCFFFFVDSEMFEKTKDLFFEAAKAS